MLPHDTVTAIEVLPSVAPGGTFTYGGILDGANGTEVTVDIPTASTEG